MGMTELQDPVEVYRQSLAGAPRVVEPHPPTIERAEVLPYPELTRLWVRIQISPFSTYPDLALTLLDPDGNVASSMYLIEGRDPYQSLTLHLRQPPRVSELYRLEIELTRDGEVLDTCPITFELTFKEPPDDHPER
jgi:hypothetical protein